MLNNKLNTHGGYIPADMTPPNEIAPRYHVTIAISAGAVWGTGTVPSVNRTSALYFHIRVKKNAPEPKKSVGFIARRKTSDKTNCKNV